MPFALATAQTFDPPVPGRCVAPAMSAPWGMARKGSPFRHRLMDTKVMFEVRFEDGRTAYIRVSPEAARYGNLVVMSIACEEQKAGTIPAGTITSVKRVH